MKHKFTEKDVEQLKEITKDDIRHSFMPRPLEKAESLANGQREDSKMDVGK